MGLAGIERLFAADAARVLSRQEAVVVGTSGGADSVALLHLLCALNERDGWSLRLHVAHLDHQLRGADSTGDAAFVRALAESLGLPCTCECADVQADAEATGLSLEEAGRACRFTFFERVCREHDVRTIALAHHADDHAETILHRILRGTGLRGLSGIPAERVLRRSPHSERGRDEPVRLVRPMLSLRRRDIEAYLREQGLTWRDDASNADQAYTRNRIRNTLLPALRAQFNPAVDEALLRLAEHAREASAFLDRAARQGLHAAVIERERGRLVLQCDVVEGQDPALRVLVIRSALEEIGARERDLSAAHLRRISDLAGGHDGTVELHLPGGVRVVREHRRLVFERTRAPARPERAEAPVVIDGATALVDWAIDLEARAFEAGPQEIASYLRERRRQPDGFAEWLDLDTLQPPLVARPYRPGDRFVPLGMTGSRKLSDFLLDEKVSGRRRRQVLVLCDQRGPVWVVPFRIAERVKLTPTTRRVLQLRVRTLEGQAAQ